MINMTTEELSSVVIELDIVLDILKNSEQIPEKKYRCNNITKNIERAKKKSNSAWRRQDEDYMQKFLGVALSSTEKAYSSISGLEDPHNVMSTVQRCHDTIEQIIEEKSEKSKYTLTTGFTEINHKA